MNAANHHPCVVSEAELRRALEQAGWRCTRQRAAVFACLQAADCHPTAEQVFLAVRRQLPHISLATVYKALEALVDAHLATRLAESGGPARYDGRSEAHYHLRCERTGQVRDLPMPYDPDLVEKLAPHLAEILRQQGFDAVVRNNLTGGFIVSREVYTQSMQHHGGSIVNMTADYRNGFPSMVHTGAARAFLGSVTDAVVRSAKCPVLVIRRD